ncbi:MAG: hypothetical protein EBV06_14825 [Planctomycetia bacterium]|nr:hypothetical protein [Planctomycetia bacterium]
MNLARYFETLRISRSLRRTVRQHGFWFVDIPRTSSSSLRWELAACFNPLYGKPSSWPGQPLSEEQPAPAHLTARNVRSMLGARLWTDSYTFSVVRNPWDRTYSLYQYRIQREGFPGDMRFTEYCQRLLAVRRGNYDPFFKNPLHHMSSCDFLGDGNGTFIVKAIVFFEQRSKGLRVVGEKIGCPNFGNKQKMLASRHEGDPRPEMEDEAVDLISEAYADDLERFSYTYPPGENTGSAMIDFSIAGRNK